MTPGSTDASAVPVPPGTLETTCVPPLPSARAEAAPPRPTSPADPELRWRQAGRALLAKTIAEFAYEDLLGPVPEPEGWHRLELPADRPGEQAVEYRFRADRGAYGSWFVDPGSVRRSGHPAADPLAFIADAAPSLGISGETAGHLVREMAATLAADAQILATATRTAAELADLDYAQLEGHQTGHPWIIFNKGRVGFYEVMVITEEIRQLAIGRASADVIAEAAIRNGMRRLRDEGLQKVRAGITSFAELARVTG